MVKFKEGTYKFSNQIRIDDDYGLTHKLSPEKYVIITM